MQSYSYYVSNFMNKDIHLVKTPTQIKVVTNKYLYLRHISNVPIVNDKESSETGKTATL